MTTRTSVSVVVPFEHAGANLTALLDSLAPQQHPDVEFLLCRTAADAGLEDARVHGNTRWLDCPPNARIPDMWRDGILAAQGEHVALLTAHCIPAPGWLDRVLTLSMASSDAGVGGHFVNPDDASASDWAVYLLRYSAFSRPNSDEQAVNIAADNAVYRRQAVLECRDLLPAGFWELEYHRLFLARGLGLKLLPDLPVTHRNRYTPQQFAAQRRAHGRQFGHARAARLRAPSLFAYLLAMPLVPVLLLARVLGRARRYGWGRELRPAVVFWLAFYCLHWALGEAVGIVGELRRRLRK